MRRFIGMAGIAAFLLLAIVSLGAAEGPATGGKRVGTDAPRFSVKNVKGEDLTLDGLMRSNKSVLVCFWGLRCGACLAEIPHLNEIYARFKGKVRMLGVNVDGADGKMLTDLMEKNAVRMEYDVVADPEFQMADAFGMTAAPLTVVIDASGKIRYYHENFNAGDEAEIAGILAQLAN